MRPGLRLALLISAFIGIGSSIHATSFDCRKAHRGYEALVCANKELSKADDALADAYHRAHGALASIGSQKEAKKAQDRLEKEQKEWLKTRLSKCPDVDCIQKEYQLRLVTLQSYVGTEMTATQLRGANPLAVQPPLPRSAYSNQVPAVAVVAVPSVAQEQFSRERFLSAVAAPLAKFGPNFYLEEYSLETTPPWFDLIEIPKLSILTNGKRAGYMLGLAYLASQELRIPIQTNEFQVQYTFKADGLFGAAVFKMPGSRPVHVNYSDNFRNAAIAMYALEELQG
jgi:uncharacterized protein